MAFSFVHLADTLAHFFTSSFGVQSVCVFIILWAAMAYLSFKRRISPLKKELISACGLLEKYPDNEIFAQNFEDFASEASKSSVLGHAWREFEETLIRDPEALVPVVKNTQSAATFFLRSNIIGTKLDLRFYSALPNLFTGAGILGTFVGLVAGIWLASQGLASSNPEDAKEALQQLLNGASLAFWTSIVGLSTSIVFSWREKHWIHRLQLLLAQWVELLDGRLARVTGESLSLGILQESQQQTRVMEQFTTDLAFQIADAFQKEIGSSMQSSLDALKDEIQGLRSDQQSNNDSALQAMLENFSTSLSGSAGQELNSLGKTLESLNDKLSTQIDTMSERNQQIEQTSQASVSKLSQAFDEGAVRLNDELSKAVSTITTGMDELIHKISDSLEKASREAAENFRQSAEEFRQTVTLVRTTLAQVNETSEGTHQLITQIQQILSSAETTTSALVSAAEPIQASVEGLSASAAEIGDTVTQVRETGTQLNQAVANLSSIQNEIKDVWKAYETRFKNVDQSLAKVFTELDSGVSRYTQSVQDFIQGLDRHTSNIVSQLAGATTELNESVEELADALGKRQ
jgi:ABC-type transporter Mla subunit MlaD